MVYRRHYNYDLYLLKCKAVAQNLLGNEMDIDTDIANSVMFMDEKLHRFIKESLGCDTYPSERFVNDISSFM